MTEEIDSEAFSGDLPSKVDTNGSSESETDRLNDLKHIYKAVTAYVVDRCRKKLPLPSGEPDLEAVAKSTSEKDVTQLLKLVFLAAIFGRYSMDYIQQLISFPPEMQAQFYLILEEPEAMEEEQITLPKEPKAGIESDDECETWSEDEQRKDREFIYEERIAKLVSSNKQLEHETVELKEQLENMHDLHTKLQKSYDNLEVKQQDTAERLEALRSGKGEQSILGIQRTKMQQQENVIATLETQVNALQEENNSLQVQQDLLKSQAEGFQQMQDDLYELKLEREQLQRKANAAEKYKQKLQSLQKVEDENEALKYRVTEMQRQLKQSDSEQFTTSGLQRENDEFRRLVSNIEQELSDSNAAKKRAEFENMTLAAKLQNADDQATRWRKQAEELQDRFNENQHPDSPSTPRAITSNGLNLPESEDGSEPDSDLNEEMSEMQVDDQNMISEQELQMILSIMKTHTQLASNAEKTSSVEEQQKLAAKIEKSRATTRELVQVIEYLSQPRVEFVGVKNLDAESPYKSVPPPLDDMASPYGLASSSAHSSNTSLSAASRRSSTASFHSIQSFTTPKTPKRRSILSGFFGPSEN